MRQPLQRERRRDPYPWTWEIPAAIAIAMSLALVLGVQLGRSMANLVVGAGWTWPTAATVASPGTAPGGGGAHVPSPPSPLGGGFWSSIPDVLAGDAGAGLPEAARARDLAGAHLVWTSTVLVEVALLVGLGGALVWAHQRWGPGRMRGMSSREDAEALLGRTRLRKVAPIVRPDLYAKRTVTAPTRVHRDAGDPASRDLHH